MKRKLFIGLFLILPIVIGSLMTGSYLTAIEEERYIIQQRNDQGGLKDKIADSPWSTFGGDNKHTGQSKYNASGNPGRVKLQMKRYISCLQPLIDNDGIIYFYGDIGISSMYLNGTIIWSNRSISNVFALLSGDGIIFLTCNQGLLALYSNNGTVKWHRQGECYTYPLLADDNIIYYYVYNNDYTASLIYSVYANNGTERWNLSINSIYLPPPAMDDEDRILIKGDKYLFAYALNGSFIWKVSDSNFDVSTPSIGSDGTIYVGGSKNLWALFPNNGTIKWKVPCSRTNNWMMPCIGPDGTIYYGGSSLLAYYPNGTLKWKYSNSQYSTGLPTIGSDGTIYYVDWDIFRAIDSSGKLIWSLKLAGDSINSGIIIQNGDIILTTVGGGYYYVIGSSKPTKPLGFSTRSGNMFVNVSWLPPSDDGGIGIDGYRLYRGSESGNLSLYMTFDGSIISYNDTNVTNGKVYFYQVSAFNKMGESDRTFEYSEKPVAIPTPPIGISVKAIGPTLRIEWMPPQEDGGAPVLNYLVYKGRSPDSLNYLYSLDVKVLFKNDSFVEWGKVYYYGVTARNRVGESALSEIGGAEVLMPPDPPQILAAKSGDRFVNISWEAPVKDGGRGVVRYELYRGQEEVGESHLIATMGNGSRWFNDTGLVNGITYRYHLRCNNTLFDSEYTEQISVVPSKRPSVPLDMTVSFNDGTIFVSWSPPIDTGGLALMRYELDKWNIDNSTRWTFDVHIGTSYNDTEYERGMLYRYRVRCFNEKGPSGYTDWIDITPPFVFDVPSPPTSAISRSGNGFVHLYWSSPYFDGGTPLLGYRIYRNGTMLIELNNRTMEYNDTGVINDRTYLYGIVSFNSVGESLRTVELLGLPKNATVNGNGVHERRAPSVPLGLSFTMEDWWVTLSWSKPADKGTSDIQGYIIYRRTGEAEDYVKTATINVTSFKDPEILKEGAYYYSVSAFNSEGEGNRTDPIRVEIKNEKNGENTPIWYYVIPIALAMIAVIAIVLLVLIKKKNGQDGLDQEVNGPSLIGIEKEE